MIYINNVPSFRDPESYKIIPDDRIEKIEIIGSVAIQDYGHISDGDVISLQCLFSEANFNQILNLWNTRTPVTFRDKAGKTFSNMLIVMKEYEPDKNFPKYIMATLELWRKPSWQTLT